MGRLAERTEAFHRQEGDLGLQVSPHPRGHHHFGTSKDYTFWLLGSFVQNELT